jgi:hypothetical protein
VARLFAQSIGIACKIVPKIKVFAARAFRYNRGFVRHQVARARIGANIAVCARRKIVPMCGGS